MKKYTVVENPSITIVGIECRTFNSPEAGPKDIPKHWEAFYKCDVIRKIPNKTSNKVIALYCDYEGDYTKPYSLVIGCPVRSVDLIPEGMVAKTIPAGFYALFRAVGEHPKSLIETWGNIWQLPDLKRTYTGDYEVYGDKFLGSPQEVEVYIAIEQEKVRDAPCNIHSMPIEIRSEGLCSIDGIKYAAVGFGTFPLKDETCLTAVETAFECGYRIIDTATYYGNFDPISEALKKYGRENFYLISKVWPNSHTRHLLKEDLKATLEKLETNYLDAYFLHWPNSRVPIEETLSTLDEFRANQLIRHIGMSNVNVNHMKRALELKIPITWVQVEMNPFYYDPELLAFCKNNKITVQAWGPLGRGRIKDEVMLTSIGKKYGKTSSQIAIKWIIQNGCLPLPGSKNPKHIKENIDVMDFVLTENEMKTIDERARTGQRERVTLDMGVGFADEFDSSYEECWPKS